MVPLRRRLGGRRLVSAHLLHDGQLDTAALGQRDPRLGALPDEEHVAQPRGKLVAGRILDVADVKAALVALPVLHHAHATSVATTWGEGGDREVRSGQAGQLGSTDDRERGHISLR